MTRRRLRSALSPLVAAVLATTQFAVPLCGMGGEAGGGTHHAESGAHSLRGQGSGSHAGPADLQDPAAVHHEHEGDTAGHESPGAEAGSTRHDTGHHRDGPQDASECLDMTLCVAPALGARAPIQPQAPASDTRILPSSAESADSVAPGTLTRPPKSR